MKKMKRISVLLLALSLVLALAACGNKAPNDSGSNDPGTNQEDSNGTPGSTPDTDHDETPGEDSDEDPGEDPGEDSDEDPSEDPGEAPEGPFDPDLNAFFEGFLASLGEDNQPALMDVEGEMLDQTYPGLGALETKQVVAKTPMITAVAFEFVLVELVNESDVQTAADILQARVDYQVETGAFYPATAEAWENAKVITNGNVVALICAGEEQARAEEEFNALFA